MGQLSRIHLDPEPYLIQRYNQRYKNGFNGQFMSVPGKKTIITAKQDVKILIDELEFNMMQTCGCFQLPSVEICWELVRSFFAEMMPLLPVVYEDKFMEDYKDLTNPPSILLLQTVLYGGAFTYRPGISGNLLTKQEAMETAQIIGKRARLLLELGFEQYNPIPIMQTLLVFMSTVNGYIEKSVTDHLRQAVACSRFYGMHLDQSDNHDLSEYEKYMYRLLWMVLQIKGQFRALAAESQLFFSSKDRTIKVLTKEELYTVKPMVQDFLVWAFEICSVAEEIDGHRVQIAALVESGQSYLHVFEKSEFMLRDYYSRLPSHLKYLASDPESQTVWSASLHAGYCTLVLVINTHKSSRAIQYSRRLTDMPSHFTSWQMTFDASWSFYQLMEAERKRCGYTYFAVYSLFGTFGSAINMTYHLRNVDPVVRDRAKEALEGFLRLLRAVEKLVPTAIMLQDTITKVQENENYYLNMLTDTLEMEEQDKDIWDKLNQFVPDAQWQP
ncbi:hypothetical protein OGAPHI_006722 [Ogataea philodendri]|uniref:Xylanolytic transcriptional activator regulatory domain-containing protein n=1 Tax=Ogataea philodendri TaxID=1378263 RepID=A0A9P8NXH3_9ASCO|nr:uncharacterized protein OGAPHI_006722 [Ogataea philodendri]KAH3661315.1 hypothetical protein OGAPHI_006722 [Ogataea philodendri]